MRLNKTVIIEVEALRFEGSNVEAFRNFMPNCIELAVDYVKPEALVLTIDGVRVPQGDYLVKEASGIYRVTTLNKLKEQGYNEIT